MTAESIAVAIIAASGGASATCVGIAIYTPRVLRDGAQAVGERLRDAFAPADAPPADMADLLSRLD